MGVHRGAVSQRADALGGSPFSATVDAGRRRRGRPSERGRHRVAVVLALALVFSALGLGSVAGASMVGSATVSLSSSAAGASGVSYTVRFTTSGTGALNNATGRITLQAPAGTVFVANDFLLTNLSTAQGPWGTSVESGLGTSTVVLQVWPDIGAGDQVEIVARGVKNTMSTGLQNLAVSTSSDTTPSNASFTVTAGNQSVGGVTVTPSSSAAGASGVSYSVGFTMSATGALNQSYGRITLQAPAGTVFATNDFQLTNLSTAQGPWWSSVESGLGTSTVVLHVGADIGAGDQVEIVARGVKNTTSTGLQNLAVSTSSDTAAKSGSFTVTAGNQSVGGASVTPSSSAAGASGVSYSVRFTTSATGALDQSYGRITLQAPAGTVFATNDFLLTNLSTAQGPWGTSVESGLGTSTVVLQVWPDISAGDQVEIVARGVKNTTSTGLQSLAVSTSSDTTPSNASFTVTAGNQSVGGASAVASVTTPGVTGVTYTLQFTTSATGALRYPYGEVVVAAPVGTKFVDNSFWVENLTTAQTSWASASSGLGTSSVRLQLGMDVASGDTIRITASNVTNTTTPGIQNVTFTTTSDQGQATAPIGIGSSAAPNITSQSSVDLTAGVGGGFWVTTTGIPIPALTSSALPTGVSFTANNNGTGLLNVSASAAAGSYPITFTAKNSVNPDAVQNFTLRITAAPVVASVSPGSGSTAGGATVTITGTNLTGATAVTFGGTAAAVFTVVNATTVTATTPAGAAGTVDVKVTTPGGTSAANAGAKFTYVAPVPAPTVTGVVPGSGSTAGGTSVTITGTDLTGATGVSFGGNAATSFTVVNATTVTATAPAGAAGTVDVKVTTPGGTSAVNAGAKFTYVAPVPAPTVTGVSPGSGSTAGGTSVTITGTDLTGATGVSFGGTAATSFTVVNATTVTATAPAGAAGTVDVKVTTPGGTSAANAGAKFTYVAPVPAPTVTGVSPGSGSTAGGTSVTITGTDLTGATAVTFGGTAAAVFSVVNATTVTATAPAGAAGTVDVKVTTPGGTSAANAGAKFTYVAPVPAPTVTGVSPGSGSTAGGTSVTITGTDLTGATAVTFGGNAATSFTVVNATTVTATAPAGAAGTVDVKVTTPGGTSAVNAGAKFTYVAPVPAPTVTGVSPGSGSTAGGTSVTITGTDLTGATAVTFGGNAATSFTVVNATTVTATAPAGAAGTVDVKVTTPGGTSVVNAGAKFTYIAPPSGRVPVVWFLAPDRGPASGGSWVFILGRSFARSSSVSFGGVESPRVTFLGSNLLLVRTPPHAAGTVDVRVTTEAGTSTSNARFTYRSRSCRWWECWWT